MTLKFGLAGLMLQGSVAIYLSDYRGFIQPDEIHRG